MRYRKKKEGYMSKHLLASTVCLLGLLLLALLVVFGSFISPVLESFMNSTDNGLVFAIYLIVTLIVTVWFIITLVIDNM